MVLESFMASSGKAKVFNSLFFVLTFLAWVCCWVSFTGVLQTISIAGANQDGSDLTGKFWWDRYKLDSDGSDSVKFSDSDNCQSDYCSKCKTGGQALVAFQVFAFFALTPTLLFALIRILGVSLSCLEPTRKSLALEFAFTCWTTFWFFLAVCVYGGECFHNVGKIDGLTHKGTGFGYLVFCFFAMVLNVALIHIIRSDSSAHLGSASGTDYQAETGADHTTNYNPPAPANYQDPAASSAYANAYNGDVQPAGGQVDDLLVRRVLLHGKLHGAENALDRILAAREDD